jgi:phage tail protein X
MVKYQTKEGDVLDWICWKHYGTTAVFEQVLAANPTLTDEKLAAGTIVLLPFIGLISNKLQQVHLWD